MTKELKQNSKGNYFGWDIQKKDLFLGDGRKLQSHYALKRSDSDLILHTHKNSYKEFSNTELSKLAKFVSQHSGMEVTATSEFQDGKTVFAFLKNEKLEKIGEHKIQDYLVIGNGHNGRHSLFIGTSTELLRCMNQFGMIQKNLNIRHSKNMELKIDDYKVMVANYFSDQADLYKTFRLFRDVKIDNKVKENLTQHLFNTQLHKTGIDFQDVRNTFGDDKAKKNLKGISTRKLNQLDDFYNSINKETNELGNTAWGFFNGVTHYTTHVDKSSVDNLGMIGKGAWLNQKAFNVLKELI